MQITRHKLKIALYFFSLLLTVIIILIIDFSYSNLTPTTIHTLSMDQRGQSKKDNGWYELKYNHTGKDSWGERVIDIKTDEYGFRSNEKDSDKSGPADFIFLGDSATYGVHGPWNETFVGMFDKITSSRVLNAAVGSYSPTAYLHQYQKAIKLKALNKDHKIIIGLDMSDVADEANEWRTGPYHPVKRTFIKNGVLKETNDKNNNTSDFRNFLQRNFSLTRQIYQFIRYGNPTYCEREIGLTNLYHGAFTWMDWEELTFSRKIVNGAVCKGYGKLGVEFGLKSIEDKIEKIAFLAKNYDAEIYLLIYPWPSDIVHTPKFNWSEYVSNLCNKIKCSGVVDLFPKFLEISKTDENWYKKYYVNGDLHHNKTGNLVIFKKLKEIVLDNNDETKFK